MKTTFEQKYNQIKFRDQEGIISKLTIIGTITYALFWFIDVIKYPQHKYEFLAVRLGFCLLFIISFLGLKRFNKNNLLNNQIVLSLMALYASSGIAYMMYLTEGPSSIYFSGINLVALFTLSFSSFNPLFFILTVLAVYVPYYYLCFVQFSSFNGWENFVVNNAFSFGTIIGIFMTKLIREQDIKRILNAEIRLEEELSSRQKVIEEKTAEAAQLRRNEAIVMISRQVAHDIKSPLSVLNLLIPQITEQSNNEKKEILVQALNRISEISDDLLVVSRNNHTTLNSSLKPLGKILDEIVREKNIAHAENVIVSDKSNLGQSRVSISEVTLKRILSNLINNAIESYIGKSGQVDVAIEPDSKGVLVRISDSGKGMTADQVNKYGKEMFSSGKADGNGLGALHAVDSIKLAGGDVVVKSEIGKGTTVSIFLPIV